jgi:hypothetical protein
MEHEGRLKAVTPAEDREAERSEAERHSRETRESLILQIPVQTHRNVLRIGENGALTC